MTGPEHYMMAEKLAEIFTTDKGAKMPLDRAAFTVALAQVHATLAAAAAGADMVWATLPAGDQGHGTPVMRAWSKATS